MIRNRHYCDIKAALRGGDRRNNMLPFDLLLLGGNRTAEHSKKDASFVTTLHRVIGKPTDAIDTEDPGDETQRNFRYQHAYGVILLVRAHLGTLPYVAIWCEQHEDFLGERTDGRYDGWQIKTRGSYRPRWRLTDP